MSLKPKARLYFQASLTGGTEVTLPSDDSHYICNVMRLKPKSEILLFNEHDGEWLAILTDAHKKHARCAVMEQRKKPPSETKELRLIFAPLKKDRMDFLIEKAVELGVTHFVPVITEHADVQKVNLDRLRAQIKEAVEQCEQLYMPEITALQKISSYLETQHDGSPIFFCQEKGKAEALKKALSRPISSKDAISFIIGPAGGFSEHEIETFNGYSFVKAVHLGPRILRAETAALTCLAIFQSICGDFEAEPNIN